MGAGLALMQAVKRRSPCGSGLARESGGSASVNVCWANAFAFKPAPTFDFRRYEHSVRLTDWHQGNPALHNKPQVKPFPLPLVPASHVTSRPPNPLIFQACRKPLQASGCACYFQAPSTPDANGS